MQKRYYFMITKKKLSNIKLKASKISIKENLRKITKRKSSSKPIKIYTNMMVSLVESV